MVATRTTKWRQHLDDVIELSPFLGCGYRRAEDLILDGNPIRTVFLMEVAHKSLIPKDWSTSQTQQPTHETRGMQYAPMNVPTFRREGTRATFNSDRSKTLSDLLDKD